jgi:AcrR family transcriptional regulator
MDLREKKTKRAIRDAFLQIRSRKPLERITIKELAETAEISKATFYLHYRDIYDLSQQLQNEVIQDVLNGVIQENKVILNVEQLTKRLYDSFYSHQNLIDILFSGTQAAVLPIRIEQGIKEHIFNIDPKAQKDAKLRVLLTYQIQGSYYAYTQNRKELGDEQVLDILDKVSFHMRTLNL